MPHLPTEGTPPPAQDPEEVIRNLEDRLVVIAAEMGRLATEMTDITAELAAYRAAGSGDQCTHEAEAEEAAFATIEVYSRVEDDASLSPEDLERISALNADYPRRIQDIFAPTLSSFSAYIPTRVQPAEDLRLNGKKLRRRPPAALPGYRESPKKWQKVVDTHAQRHQWSEIERQDAFRAQFTLDYVELAGGEKELVGYGFTGSGRHLLFGNVEASGLDVKIVCADNLVRKAAFKYYRKSTEKVYAYHPETTTLDFHDNSIEVRGGYENRDVFRTYRYVPEEYRYELVPHGGGLLPADIVLKTMQGCMASIPTRK